MLIGVELITEVVQSTLLTSKLKHNPPLSLMLIAAPESGKTSIVVEKGCEKSVIASDATGSGFTQELMQRPDVSHIVINDMVAIMAHKETVNKRTFAILNGMTEEGLQKIMLPGSGSFDFKGKKCGIICCVPLEIVNDGRLWWNRSGFSSRMLPFAYRYSRELLMKIKRDVITTGVFESDNNGTPTLKLPEQVYDLKISPAVAPRIQELADNIAIRLGEQGLRRGKQLRALARGHAILRNSKNPVVNEEDIQFIRSITPHISYTECADLIPPLRVLGAKNGGGNVRFVRSQTTPRGPGQNVRRLESGK